MVKIPLSTGQINSLLKWRDSHKELVRAVVIPFPECSILCENGIKIRVKQDDTIKSVYHFTATNTQTRQVDGRFSYSIQNKIVINDFPVLSHEDKESAITIWATVSAYVVNFQPEEIERERSATQPQGKNHRSTESKPADRVIHLKPIVYSSSSESPAKRKYTLCENAFSVRGHYRHYKSGKVVYVRPYEKNTGKEKDKRNKVLKIGEV